MFKSHKSSRISSRLFSSIIAATLALCMHGCGGGSGTSNSGNANGGPSPGPTGGDSQNQEQAEVIAAANVATSDEPLTTIPPELVELGGEFKQKEIHLNPNVLVNLGPGQPDPALQPPGPPSAPGTAPSGKNIGALGSKFKGPQGDFNVRSAPPDTTGAVGDTQFVQWVNNSFAVFDKNTGKVLAGPIAGNKLFKKLGGTCAKDNDGDPVVVFDKFARRWVLAQFAVSSGFSQCVAVSTSSDATGTYHLYEFTYPAFDDYPKIGVWADGYYVTFNMFDSNDRFIGSRVCAYDRVKMLSGQPATQQCFQLNTNFFGLLPADIDGATSALADANGNPNGPAAPPAGSPNYILGLDRDSTSLDFWKFHVDWVKSSNSTLGVSGHNPNAKIAVAPFTLACNGSGRNCVPQPGANNPEKLDTLGERLMFRLAYRHFSDHDSLLASHSVDTGPPNPRTGVRWYELRNLNTTPTVFQQSTYAPDASHRWIPAVAMDKSGNIAAGYNISSTTIFPGIRFASRQPSDPINRLGTEMVLANGSGTQRCTAPDGTCFGQCGKDASGKCRTLTRWGDYSTLSIDPTDDCTFWYTAETGEETGAFKWHTRILSFKLPTCH